MVQGREHPVRVLPRLFGYPLLFRVHVCRAQGPLRCFPSAGLTCNAPLPSTGSRWPRFPAFDGTMRALRLPAPHALRLIVFASRVRRVLPVRVRRGAPGGLQVSPRAWSLWISRHSLFRPYPFGQMRDLPGSVAVRPVILRRPKTPDDPCCLASYRQVGCCPRLCQTEGVINFAFRGLPRRFITRCLRFMDAVAGAHARLASGWRAAPLPGRS